MENTYQTPDESTDFLTQAAFHLQQASVGKRFANYLVDVACLYIFWIVLFFLLALINPSGYWEAAQTMKGVPGYLISMLSYALLLGTMEALFKGKTLGKLITRTRVVNEDGSRISVKTAFIRGFCRIVPFEPFSAFSGYPWHDSWTKTYVIDERASVL